APEVKMSDRNRPAAEVLRSGLRILGCQEAGDQVPGDHEEDVDPDEAAVKAPDLQVTQDHQNDGHGTQTFDVRPETNHVPPEPLGRMPRFIPTITAPAWR